MSEKIGEIFGMTVHTNVGLADDEFAIISVPAGYGQKGSIATYSNGLLRHCEMTREDFERLFPRPSPPAERTPSPRLPS